MGYHVAGSAMHAEEAIECLEKGGIDLAILDIHLGKGPSGIWLGGQIQEKYALPFIFLSAFSDKKTIASAAKTQPSSYLVKPFVQKDLHAAIELALHSYTETALAETSGPAGLLINDNIFVKDQMVYRRIPIKDIAFIQAFKNYLEITVGDKKYILRSALKAFFSQLPEGHFFQTHRSYVVNMAMVDQIGGNFVGIGKHEIPLSRGLKTEVVNRLNMFG